MEKWAQQGRWLSPESPYQLPARASCQSPSVPPQGLVGRGREVGGHLGGTPTSAKGPHNTVPAVPSSPSRGDCRPLEVYPHPGAAPPPPTSLLQGQGVAPEILAVRGFSGEPQGQDWVLLGGGWVQTSRHLMGSAGRVGRAPQEQKIQQPPPPSSRAAPQSSAWRVPRDGEGRVSMCLHRQSGKIPAAKDRQTPDTVPRQKGPGQRAGGQAGRQGRREGGPNQGQTHRLGSADKWLDRWVNRQT